MYENNRYTNNDSLGQKWCSPHKRVKDNMNERLCLSLLEEFKKFSEHFPKSDQKVIKNATMAGKMKGLSDEEILRMLDDSDSEDLSELLSNMSFYEDSSSEEDEANERPPEDVIPRHRILQNPEQGSSTHIRESN